MSAITDDQMRQMLAQTRAFSVVILKKGPNYQAEGDRSIVWEHVRRNFVMRAAGQLVIVMPVADQSDVSGIGVFSTDLDATAALMDADPGVQAGWFTYEVHPSRSFPGDALPG